MSNSEILRHRLKFITNDTKNYDRFSYYTLVDIEINGKIKSIEFKLDTGSPCTVIGLNLLKKVNIDLTEEIEKIGLQDRLIDVSGGDIRIAPYIVQDFRITEDIILKNVLIYVSPDIQNRAILGMDILSLFDFQYKWEKHSMTGTFWINNYEERKKLIDKKLKDKGLNILDSRQIFLLDPKDK